MAKASSSGVNTKAAKKAYTDVKKHIAQLEAYVKQLQTDVETTNKDMWYGGKKANKWYTSTSSTFEGIVKFDQGIEQFQKSLQQVFSKASSSGISFM